MSKLLTLNQVSHQIGFSESSIRRYLKAGEFPLPLKKAETSVGTRKKFNNG
ncbi:helix-turn-helix transcriptional regulator [Neptuniibacter sp. PT8_73]|uniref:helix-turn-helix transcriptional regulator n=1 Tax=Neptuniibacter sp. PT8_73 TaxID=3398206 RepID=UPI0039F51100